MSNLPDGATKTCKTCRNEIALAARKCPFCREWQDRFSAFANGPLGIFSLMFLLVVVTIGLVAWLQASIQPTLSRDGQPFGQHADQVTVVESTVRFGADENGPVVAVVGKIKNSSPLDWKDVHLQVCFFDSQGKLVDAGEEKEYRYPFLPVDQEIGFKISFPREFPESQYARHTVRVISAKDSRAIF